MRCGPYINQYVVRGGPSLLTSELTLFFLVLPIAALVDDQRSRAFFQKLPVLFLTSLLLGSFNFQPHVLTRS